MKKLIELVRPNIWSLTPYSSARDEYKGAAATVFLDANENPYNAPVNRYPDPLQHELKAKLAEIKGVKPEQIFLGNGSDEAIDLVYRIFCEPGKDNVVAIDPTYGMYKVAADINNVKYKKVELDYFYEFYQLPAGRVLSCVDWQTKAIFICSPNNPTGNAFRRNQIEDIITGFASLVVLDEAYGDFSNVPSFLPDLDKYPNLIILQTFSKAWGSAGIRLGMAFASPEIIALFNKVKYPYNVNALTQQKGLEMLSDYGKIEEWVKTLVAERDKLMKRFASIPCVKKVFPSDANFFLAKVTNATGIYDYLVEQGIIVRNRSSVAMCNNCLRITVGTPEENNKLVDALLKYRTSYSSYL